MKKIYLESLNNNQLMEIIESNTVLKSKLENCYMEGILDYVGEILDYIGGEYNIGFYQYNYWKGARNLKELEGIANATEDFGLLSEDELEKVNYCIELLNRLNNMDYDNKQYDNLETKIYNLFNEIDVIVLDNLNNLVDDKYIDEEILLDELYNMLDLEGQTYYILEGDEDYNIYHDMVLAF